MTGSSAVCPSLGPRFILKINTYAINELLPSGAKCPFNFFSHILRLCTVLAHCFECWTHRLRFCEISGLLSSYQIKQYQELNFTSFLQPGTWVLSALLSHCTAVLSSANGNIKATAAVLAVLHSKTATYDGSDRQSTVHTEKK